MIVDGKKIAEEIIVGLLEKRAALPRDLRLGVVLGEDDPVTSSFVRIKERVAARLDVELVRRELSRTATTADTVRTIESLAKETNGIIVQLPLPATVDMDTVLESIPHSHDVDGIHPEVFGRIVRPPVAGAVAEVFNRCGTVARGTKAVVVGAGKLVGAPVAELLRDLGARVEVVTHTRGSLGTLHDADIVVLGAGDPGMVKPAMLMPHVVLIDAGTSEAGGKIAGDADPACAEVASVFTPVPGGIGPIAVAMIFKNLFDLVKKQTSSERR